MIKFTNLEKCTVFLVSTTDKSYRRWGSWGWEVYDTKTNTYVTIYDGVAEELEKAYKDFILELYEDVTDED